MLDLPTGAVTFLFDRPDSLQEPEHHVLLDAAMTIAPKQTAPLIPNPAIYSDYDETNTFGISSQRG